MNFNSGDKVIYFKSTGRASWKRVEAIFIKQIPIKKSDVTKQSVIKLSDGTEKRVWTESLEAMK